MREGVRRVRYIPPLFWLFRSFVKAIRLRTRAQHVKIVMDKEQRPWTERGYISNWRDVRNLDIVFFRADRMAMFGNLLRKGPGQLEAIVERVCQR